MNKGLEPRWGNNPPPAQTATDVAQLICGVEGCTHHDHDVLYLHGRCHMNSPTNTRVLTDAGIIEVWCATCGLGIGRFKLAPGGDRRSKQPDRKRR